jgi:hypothetical protein
MGWRPHSEDGKCDWLRCRQGYTETHISKKRTYAVCDAHIEDAIVAATTDNKEARL